MGGGLRAAVLDTTSGSAAAPVVPADPGACSKGGRSPRPITTLGGGAPPRVPSPSKSIKMCRHPHLTFSQNRRTNLYAAHNSFVLSNSLHKLYQLKLDRRLGGGGGGLTCFTGFHLILLGFMLFHLASLGFTLTYLTCLVSLGFT